MSELLSLQTLLVVCIGIGLSAACGFRVFLPPLVLGIAQRMDVPLTDLAPEWLGSVPALIVLGAAGLFEIGAFYIPWLDNVLDTIASPAAVLAGVLLTAGLLDDLDPMWRWFIAITAGGGAAGITQSATVITRGLSTATTGGLANFLLATFEWVAAILLAVVAVLLAPLAVLLFIAVVVWLFRALARRRQQKLAPA